MSDNKTYFQWNRIWLPVLGGVWALPYTLIGVLLGMLGTNRWQMHKGTVEILLRNGPVRYCCDRIGISAFTLGDCVLYNVEPNQNLREHEGRHTRQYWVLGPFFLPLYFILLALRGYYNHPLEKDARKWEEQVCGCLYGSNIGQKPENRPAHDSPAPEE